MTSALMAPPPPPTELALADGVEVGASATSGCGNTTGAGLTPLQFVHAVQNASVAVVDCVKSCCNCSTRSYSAAVSAYTFDPGGMYTEKAKENVVVPSAPSYTVVVSRHCPHVSCVTVTVEGDESSARRGAEINAAVASGTDWGAKRGVGEATGDCNAGTAAAASKRAVP